jgi:hypothetical protein
MRWLSGLWLLMISPLLMLLRMGLLRLLPLAAPSVLARAL